MKIETAAGNLYVDPNMELLLIEIAKTLRSLEDNQTSPRQRQFVSKLINILKQYDDIKEVEKYDKHRKELINWAEAIINKGT